MKEQEAEEERKAQEEQEKKEAEEKLGYETGITYEQLARTPDDYGLKKFKFYGKVRGLSLECTIKGRGVNHLWI